MLLVTAGLLRQLRGVERVGRGLRAAVLAAHSLQLQPPKAAAPQDRRQARQGGERVELGRELRARARVGARERGRGLVRDRTAEYPAVEATGNHTPAAACPLAPEPGLVQVPVVLPTLSAQTWRRLSWTRPAGHAQVRRLCTQCVWVCRNRRPQFPANLPALPCPRCGARCQTVVRLTTCRCAFSAASSAVAGSLRPCGASVARDCLMLVVSRRSRCGWLRAVTCDVLLQRWRVPRPRACV